MALRFLRHSLRATRASLNQKSKNARCFESVATEERRIARLRVFGDDRRGLVASFVNLLDDRGCNILDLASEQTTDESARVFFQRIVFDHSQSRKSDIKSSIEDLSAKVQMTHELNWVPEGKEVVGSKKRVAIFVGKSDHCLWELLLRHRSGELDCDISMVISNHDDGKNAARAFDIPYHRFLITKENKEEQEQLMREELRKSGVDLVVLARYMQVLSNDFILEYPNRIINIHHSFLPAFVGSKPYHRAHERGVKLVGATAHYATIYLDEGPIIEQDITRIRTDHTINDLIRKGRTLEKNVLFHAVKAHLDDRIIVYKNKCIIFND